MPLVCSLDESRDLIPVINPANGEIVVRVGHAEAQRLQLSGEVTAIARHNNKGRIHCLMMKPSHPETASTIPAKPSPVSQRGIVGYSHRRLRECSCKECKASGAPIPQHLYRSKNPKGVWTIDELPVWGKNDQKMKALFSRPILECKYGKLKVDERLSPPRLKSPPSKSLLPLPAAA